MPPQEWYYAKQGQRLGPVTGTELAQLYDTGQLLDTDHVWTKGMSEWAPVSQAKQHFYAPQPTVDAVAQAPHEVGDLVLDIDLELDKPITAGYTYPKGGGGGGGYSDYAGFWLRAVAFLIDSVITGIAGAVLGGCVGGIMGGLMGAAGGFEGEFTQEQLLGFQLMGNIIAIIVGWLYYALLEASSWQATLGKKALGLKVVDLDGDRISFLRATGRHFGKIISSLICFVGFFMAGFTEKKQALHDMMAGCLVVRG